MDESKAVKIVKSLINLVGVTAGIIIASIGAIMFLNAIFNLYLFGIDKPQYSDYYYRCEVYDIDRVEARILTGANFSLPSPLNEDDKNLMNNISKLTSEQKDMLREKYEDCMQEADEDMINDFRTDQKRNMATGLAFMIVGFPLIYFYQRKKSHQ